jgi:hypothetical protein
MIRVRQIHLWQVMVWVAIAGLICWILTLPIGGLILGTSYLVAVASLIAAVVQTGWRRSLRLGETYRASGREPGIGAFLLGLLILLTTLVVDWLVLLLALAVLFALLFRG